MKTRLYLLIFSIMMVGNLSFGQQFSEEQITWLKTKVKKIVNLHKSIAEQPISLRANEAFEPDSMIEYSYDTDLSEFVEDGRYIMYYTEIGDSKRISHIDYYADFSDLELPFPAEKIVISWLYDGTDRVIGLTVVISFGFFELEALAAHIRYDAMGRVIFTSFGGLLFEDIVLKDSIVYVDNSNNLPESIHVYWSGYQPELEDSTGYYLAYKRTGVQYNSDQVMTDYTEESINGEFSYIDIYENVAWYEYKSEFALYLSDEAADTGVNSFLGIFPEKPVEQLNQEQTNYRRTELNDDLPFDLITFRTTEFREDSIIFITDEPGVFKQLEIYVLSTEGNVLSNSEYYDFDLNELLPLDRTTYDYDSRGNMILSLREQFNEGDWMETNRNEYEYEYDSIGRNTVFSEWFISQGIIDFATKYEFFYPEIIDTYVPNLNKLNAKVSIHPNPTIDFIQLRVEDLEMSERVSMRLTNSQGQVLWTGRQSPENGGFQDRINISGFIPGVYFLQVSQNNSTATFAVVKK